MRTKHVICRLGWMWPTIGLAASGMAVSAVSAQSRLGTVPNQPPRDATVVSPETVAPTRPTLWVGDQAPALAVEKWVKGDAVKPGEAGMTMVVEFWATWCGPCIESIPHLTELQRTFKDRKVTVVGVASQEMSAVNLEKFVRRQGDRMDYSVALDDNGAANRAWMEAAGQRGIPTAFVVDVKGRIAWIGHPQDGLDEALARIVEDRYDLSAAAAAHRKRMELDLAATPILERFRELAESGDHAGAAAAADALVKLDAREFARYAIIKYQIQAGAMKDYERASREATEAIAGPLKNNAAMLTTLALAACDDPRIDTRDYELAERAAARADELTEGKRADVQALRGRIAWARGDRKEAIDRMSMAVKLATESPEKERAQRLLDEYTAAEKKKK